MKAILIDPFTETISEVDYVGPYQQIYALLSHETMPVDCYTVVGLDDGESIFVDDEGLLKDPTHFFIWKDYPQPLAGKGLILGCDDEGKTIGTELTLDYVKSKVIWANNIELSHMEEVDGVIDHPLLGPNTPLFGSRPVFVRREK